MTDFSREIRATVSTCTCERARSKRFPAADRPLAEAAVECLRRLQAAHERGVLRLRAFRLAAAAGCRLRTTRGIARCSSRHLWVTASAMLYRSAPFSSLRKQLAEQSDLACQKIAVHRCIRCMRLASTSAHTACIRRHVSDCCLWCLTDPCARQTCIVRSVGILRARGTLGRATRIPASEARLQAGVLALPVGPVLRILHRQRPSGEEGL